MEEAKTRFQISFRKLLQDMTRNLGWSNPLYRSLDLGTNMAFVVICHGCFSESFFFKGEPRHSMLESEESAVEQAVNFIAVKERILIDDVNCLNKEKYKKTADFYCAKTLLLQRLIDGKEEGSEVSKVENKETLYSQVVSIDFDDLLGNVMDYYQMARTEPEENELTVGNYVVSFALYHLGSDNLIDWIIGETCPSVSLAEKSAAKKAIVFIQSVRDFEVKDASYTEMRIAKNLCSIEQEIYLIIKDRVNENSSTPKRSGSTTLSLVGPPLPPTKPKRKAIHDGSGSSRITYGLSVPDDLTEVFKQQRNH